MNRANQLSVPQALSLLNRGQTALAHEEIKAYLAAVPKDPAGWNTLGLIYARESRWKEAAQAYQRALSHNRAVAGIHNNMGTALRHLGELTQAEKAHRRALQLDPKLKEAYNNLGLVFLETSRAAEAELAFRKTLSFDPVNIAARENLSKSLYIQGRRRESAAASESLLALVSPELAWNLSLAELASGNWERAWRLYESRFHRPKGKVLFRHGNLPAWAATEKSLHLLVWGEQGAGDQIMASRWLHLAEARVGKLSVECDHRLLTLFQNSFPGIHFFPARGKARAEDMEGITHQCPILDLPQRLQLQGGADYAQSAALTPSAATRAAWKARLGEPRARRIGLVWAGNPSHVSDKQRSLAFEHLKPLVAAFPDMEFHSFQVGNNAVDTVGSGLPVQNWAARLNSFEDTAALLELMDAVVTVDTSVVHLAGTLGRPTWLLLPTVPEWRWDAAGQEGNDSLWYDSVRYARQQTPGDWASAIIVAIEGLRRHFPLSPSSPDTAAALKVRWKKTVQAIREGKATAQPVLQQFSSDSTVARLWLKSLLQKKNDAVALSVASALLRHSRKDIQLLLLASDIARKLGKADVALEHARQAMALDQDNPECHLHQGNALREKGDLEGAAQALERALQIKPDYTTARTNLAVVRREMGDLPTAIALYRQVVEQNPDYLPARSNLGNALRDEGTFDESADCFRYVIERDPSNPEMYYGLGNTLKENLLVTEAIDVYRQGLAVSPKHSDLKVNLSLQLLLDGQLAEGWDLYEERFLRPVRPVPQRKFPQPWWRGESLKNQALLLWGEQGAGDKLMFARLLPRAISQAGQVIVETDPRMLTLMQRSFPEVAWVAEKNPPEAVTQAANWQAPIGHLAKVFLRSLDQFDDGSAYLKPDPEKVLAWKERLSVLPGKKVGVVWAGNPGHQNDKNRSMSLEVLSPLLALPGISFVSLQVGPEAGKFGHHANRFFDAAPMIQNYDDTAALMANLDMVVGVDTSVIHLAGAVGCPTHAFIPYCPDWRWMVRFPDGTPWYRSVRLYRQSCWQDWTEAVASAARNIEQALGELGKRVARVPEMA